VNCNGIFATLKNGNSTGPNNPCFFVNLWGPLHFLKLPPRVKEGPPAAAWIRRLRRRWVSLLPLLASSSLSLARNSLSSVSRFGGWSGWRRSWAAVEGAALWILVSGQQGLGSCVVVLGLHWSPEGRGSGWGRLVVGGWRWGRRRQGLGRWRKQPAVLWLNYSRL
jgi:hypothetical protein